MANSRRRGIWATKLVLLCVGIASGVALLKLALIPYILLIASTLPSLSLFLSPPYIYIFLNFIIITIAASYKHPPPNTHHHDDTSTNPIDWPTQQQEHDFTVHQSTAQTQIQNEPVESSPVVVVTTTSRAEPEVDEPEVDKPVVVEPEVEETLDSLWKAITEKPRLQKSDTWNARMAPAKKEMRKWDTFKNTQPQLQGLVREKSMTQDELNHRVEAFIQKFNNDIRLQRQESDQRYIDMVNRSVY